MLDVNDSSSCCTCCHGRRSSGIKFAFHQLVHEIGVAEEMLVNPLLVIYGIILVMVALFFLWEDAPFHRSQRMETLYLKIIITLLFCTTAVAWLGSPSDTTVSMHESVDGLVMFVILVHVWKKHRLKAELPRFHSGHVEPGGSLRRCTAPPRAVRAAREMKEMKHALLKGGRWVVSDLGIYAFIVVALVVSAVAQLENRYLWTVGHSAQNLMWTIVLVQGSILAYAWFLERDARRGLREHVSEIVEKRDSETLEHVLETLSVGTLLEVLDRDVKQSLCEGALKADLLSTRCKAILIDGLAKSGVVSNALHAELLGSLILSTDGLELTKLKDLIDGGGEYHNMFKLIYWDVANSELRNQLLAHLRKQAKLVREQLGRSVGVKILSDVDDTLYSSGGKFPAGCDRRYPKHVVYAGCLGVYEALDRGWREGTSSCNLVFLSARPHIYKSVAEDQSYQLFRELVREEGGMHSLPTLLPGHKLPGAEAMLTHCCRRSGAWHKVGRLKHETFLKYADLYREFDFVFFGDNGQGDLLAAQLMMQGQAERSQRLLPEPQPKLLAALIHEVIAPEDSLSLRPKASRNWLRRLEQQGIFHHSSYVGAAVALHVRDPQLMPVQLLAEVAARAVRDFDRVRVMYPDWPWLEPERALEKDLQAAAKLVEGAGLRPAAPLTPTEHLVERTLLLWPEDDSSEASGSSSSDT